MVTNCNSQAFVLFGLLAFKTRSHSVAHTDLELIIVVIQPRLASNSRQPFCLSLSSAGIMDRRHHTQVLLSLLMYCRYLQTRTTKDTWGTGARVSGEVLGSDFWHIPRSQSWLNQPGCENWMYSTMLCFKISRRKDFKCSQQYVMSEVTHALSALI